jgi:hypothetical protein
MEELISRLDRSLRALDSEAALAAKSGKATTQAPLLSEYIQLTTTEGIIPAIQFIVLDGLAKHFNLYQDDRECSKILAAMADELASSSESEILVSIQIVQYTYPSLYNLSRELIDLTQKRALEHLTKLPIAEQIVTNNYSAQEEVTTRPQQNRSSEIVSSNTPNSLQPIRSKVKVVRSGDENPFEAIKSSTAAAKNSKFYIYTKDIIKWLLIISGFIIKYSLIIFLFMLAMVAAMMGGSTK